jgi:hypothetical protein
MPLIITLKRHTKHVAALAKTPRILLSDNILCNICTPQCLTDDSTSSILDKHKKTAEVIR